MDSEVSSLTEFVLLRLKQMAGAAWVDPLRVDITLRAKFRPSVDAEVRYFGSAVVTFPQVVVTYEFNLGERIVSRAR